MKNKEFKMLFSPIKIGNVEIKNRITLEPMLTGVGQGDGTANDRLIAYYTERAKGGVGLIHTEVTRINDWTGATSGLQLSVTHDRCIESLRKLADSIHQYDAKLFVQLHHPGRQSLSLVVTAWKLSEVVGRKIPKYWDLFYTLTRYFDILDSPFMHNFYFPTVAPSAVPSGLGSAPVRGQGVRALTLREIKKLEEDFVAGAVRVKKAGADGVQLHASHGYLIQQFLSPHTNRRTDEYGGPLDNRLRFLRNIIEGVRRECGPDFPITVRLTVDEYYRLYGYENVGLHLEEGVEIAKKLESYGIDALDISSGTYDTMNSWLEPTCYELGWRKGNAAAVKKVVSIPVIAANHIKTPAQAEAQLQEGTQDIIGLGRPLLADPYWAQKAEEGRPEDITRCISCLWCIESMMAGAMTNNPLTCALNPRTCHELEYPLNPPKDGGGKVVAVVGAGPAGLMAAKVLAERDFKVVVFEKNDKVGGQLILAATPPKKEKLGWACEDLEHQAKKAGAEIRFNTVATYENLKELDPYAIIDASGGHAIWPHIPGYNLPNVCTSTEILDGSVKLTGKKVAVVGSGMSGLETANYLAQQGNQIMVIEMADTIAPNTWKQNVDAVVPELEAAHAKFITSAKLQQINEGSVTVELLDKFKITTTYPCDNVVLAVGVEPNKIDDKIKTITPRYFKVGDAEKYGRIAQATQTAYDVALQLK
ncbi:MAG: FAD-dependent oxidoreductase [Ruminococcaceae bacterium]|mgnify:CR=1 FL=1|nr:FAD-dependent oxidoreductase [Oscillospiraceae bacterium]